MKDDKIILTPEQAFKLIGEQEQVHTFRSGTGMLIGWDWSMKSLAEAINSAIQIEIGGDQCKAMGHGLVVWTSESDPLFVEVSKDDLFELEKSLTVV